MIFVRGTFGDVVNSGPAFSRGDDKEGESGIEHILEIEIFQQPLTWKESGRRKRKIMANIERHIYEGALDKGTKGE